VVIGVVLLNRASTDGTGLRAAGSTSPTTRPNHGHGTTTTAPTAPTTTTTPVRAPQAFRTLVANSTSVQNQAGRYTTVLHTTFGYNTLPAVDSTIRNLTTSRVYYEPGFNGEAAVLATKLGLPKSSVLPMPATPPVVYLNAANVLLVVGLDLANATANPTGNGTTGAQSSASTDTTVRQLPATTAPPRTTTTVHS
jgi:hypothetical protein